MKRWLTPPLGLWLAFVLAAVFIVANSHFVADMSAFLPRNPTEQQQILVDQLTRGPLSRTLLIGIEGGTLERRQRLSRRFVEAVREGQAFDLISNGESLQQGQELALFLRYRYLLSPAVTAERFSSAGLHQAISQTIDNLSSSMGNAVKQLLLRDPTGEVLGLMADLDAENRPQSIDGVWFSKDGKRAIILGLFKADGADTDAQVVLLDQLKQKFEQVRQAENIPEAHLLLAGSAVYAVDARNTIKHEVSQLSLLGMLGVMTLLLLAFRSLSAFGMSILPVFSAALAGTAAVSLVFGSVHGITVGFGSTLIGEAVDYSIYYIIQSQARLLADRQDSSAWLRNFWPTIRLGMMTSVCGFAALIFSGFPGLAQLGVYSIAGLLTAAAVTRFVLPSFRPRRNAFVVSEAVLDVLQPIITGLQSMPRYLLGLALVAFVFLMLKQGSIWNSALSGLSPIPVAAQKLDETLRNDLGAAQMRFMMIVEAPDQEKVLRGAERVSDELRVLQAREQIAGFESPSKILPSQFAQRQRQQSLPSAADLAARLPVALGDLPLRPARLSPFIDDVAQARQLPLLSHELIRGTSLALSFDALMLQTRTGSTGFLPVRQNQLPDQDAANENQRVAQLSQALGNAAQLAQADLRQQGLSDVKISFIDIAGESVKVYAKYFDEIMLMSMIGFVAMSLLLYLRLRCVRRTLAVLFPLLLAVLLVMASLVAAGEKLTLLHLVGLLLIVALGSNYALFFNLNATAKAADKASVVMFSATTFGSLLLANAATAIGFGVLAASTVPVLHALGVTVAPGAIAALLLSVAFAPRMQVTNEAT